MNFRPTPIDVKLCHWQFPVSAKIARERPVSEYATVAPFSSPPFSDTLRWSLVSKHATRDSRFFGNEHAVLISQDTYGWFGMSLKGHPLDGNEDPSVIRSQKKNTLEKRPAQKRRHGRPGPSSHPWSFSVTIHCLDRLFARGRFKEQIRLWENVALVWLYMGFIRFNIIWIIIRFIWFDMDFIGVFYALMCIVIG